MNFDEIENTNEYKKIEKELNEKIEIKLKLEGYNDQKKLGFCHIYWNLKKQILKSDYNIDWKSPEELNPEITFD